MPRIAGFAAYFPRLTMAAEEYRVHSGSAPKGLREKRVAGYDDDCTTLAVAAGRRALAEARIKPASLGAVFVAASQPVRTEIVALALGTQGSVRQVHGDGAAALALADAHVAAHRKPALALAAAVNALPLADEREQRLGDGAVGLAVASKGFARMGKARRRSSEERESAAFEGVVGDLGPVAGLARLAQALAGAKPGQRLTLPLQDHGGRGVTVAVQAKAVGRSVTEALPEPMPIAYGRYAALRGAKHDTIAQGVYVSKEQFVATLPERLRSLGQRCGRCGRAVFPKRLACPTCDGRLTEVQFSPLGTIYSVTTIGRGSAPSEFAEQQAVMGPYDVAILELAEGPRVAVQLTDCEPGKARIGTRAELVVKKLYTQDGEARYGPKAVPFL